MARNRKVICFYPVFHSYNFLLKLIDCLISALKIYLKDLNNKVNFSLSFDPFAFSLTEFSFIYQASLSQSENCNQTTMLRFPRLSIGLS